MHSDPTPRLAAPAGLAVAHRGLLVELIGALHRGGTIDMGDLLIASRLRLQKARFDANYSVDTVDALAESVRVLEEALGRS